MSRLTTLEDGVQFSEIIKCVRKILAKYSNTDTVRKTLEEAPCLQRNRKFHVKPEIVKCLDLSPLN